MYDRPLRLESLEDRRMLAGVTVGNLNDVVNGATTSIAALIASPGADGISLREAILAANADTAADTIDFAPSVTGVIELTTVGHAGELAITSSLTINGPGAGTLAISASHGADGVPNTGDGFRIFNISGGGLLNVTLAGLTITGGDAAGPGQTGAGGGIFNVENLTLDRVVLTANAAKRDGGGLIHATGALTVIDSQISDNFGRDGGGLAIGSGTATIERSTITNNAGVSGGGVYKSGGAVLSILDSTLRDNTATGAGTTGNGGGVHSVGAVSIDRSTINGNRTTGADSEGGGVFATGDVTLTATTVDGNSTTGFNAQGGGILAQGSLTVTGSTISRNFTTGVTSHIAGAGAFGNLTLTNSTVSGNRTQGGQSVAGGVTADGALTIRHSTITDNHANEAGHTTLGGGGVRKSSGTLTIQDSIVAGNTTTSGDSPDLRPGTATLDVDYSLIGDASGSGVTAATGTGNLLDIDPQLGPLADNGGPTQTHALLPGSTAVNTGNPIYVDEANAFAHDQRGVPFDRIAGGRIDMGAFELPFNVAPPGATLVVDIVTDEIDGNFAAGDLSLREALYIANLSIGSQTITFHPSAFGTAQTIALDPAHGQLSITDSASIQGPGRNLLHIDAGLSSRILGIDDNTPNLISVSMSGVTLSGGSSQGGAAQSTPRRT